MSLCDWKSARTRLIPELKVAKQAVAELKNPDIGIIVFPQARPVKALYRVSLIVSFAVSRVDYLRFILELPFFPACP
jgi:hypothetical protein